MKIHDANIRLTVTHASNTHLYYMIIEDNSVVAPIIVHEFIYDPYNSKVKYENFDISYSFINYIKGHHKCQIHNFKYLSNLEKYCFFATYEPMNILKEHKRIIEDGLCIVLDILVSQSIDNNQLKELNKFYNILTKAWDVWDAPRND